MDERPQYMWTDDRVAQVNYLRQTAADIASYGSREDGDGEARVAEWEEQSRATDGLPDWYDAHDRKLLVEWTDKSLGNS